MTSAFLDVTFFTQTHPSYHNTTIPALYRRHEQAEYTVIVVPSRPTLVLAQRGRAGDESSVVEIRLGTRVPFRGVP